jgi:hypothetical protein
VFKERPLNRPPSAKEDDDFDCACRNERHVDDGKNTFLKTPTFTEDKEDKEDEDEEQQVSIEDTARLEKIESEDEDARRNILLVVLEYVCCLLLRLFFYL